MSEQETLTLYCCDCGRVFDMWTVHDNKTGDFRCAGYMQQRQFRGEWLEPKSLVDEIFSDFKYVYWDASIELSSAEQVLLERCAEIAAERIEAKHE